MRHDTTRRRTPSPRRFARVVAPATALFLMTGLAACSSSTPATAPTSTAPATAEPTITTPFTDPSQPVRVPRGTVFSLGVPVAGDGSQSWSLGEDPASSIGDLTAILFAIGSEYRFAQPSDPVGTPNLQLFTFRAQNPGTTAVTLIPPADTDVPAVRFQVQVQAG